MKAFLLTGNGEGITFANNLFVLHERTKIKNTLTMPIIFPFILRILYIGPASILVLDIIISAINTMLKNKSHNPRFE